MPNTTDGLADSSGATRAEMLACVLARQFLAGDVAIVGGASMIPIAGVLLAQHLYVPDMTVLTGSGAVNPQPHGLHPSGAALEYVKAAEAYFDIEDVFDATEAGAWSVGIFGGMQVDAFGNANLAGITDSDGGLVAGPGLVNVGVTMTIGRIVLALTEHSPRTLVRRVDEASVAGRRRPDGTPYPASRLGAGPVVCVTPMGVFGFDDYDRMRLESVHAGFSVADVAAQTGFSVATEDVPSTAPPTSDELGVIRRVVDPEGRLRRARVVPRPER